MDLLRKDQQIDINRLQFLIEMDLVRKGQKKVSLLYSPSVSIQFRNSTTTANIDHFQMTVDMRNPTQSRHISNKILISFIFDMINHIINLIKRATFG